MLTGNSWSQSLLTDYLEANFDDETQWFIYIESDAVTVDDQTKEAVQRLEGLYDAFGDFIIPTKVTMRCRLFSGDDTISECQSGLHDAPFQKNTYSSKEGVDINNIRSDFQDTHEKGMYIIRIDVDRTKVKIELESGVHYIDLDSPRYRYPEKSRASDEDPVYEPLRPKNLRFGDHSWVEEEYPFSYRFIVSLHSDIWYEDTDVAKRNQQNLRDFLERVETNLPVISVRREPGLHTVEQLKEIY